ncbi:MAG: hypothetical protein AB7O59_24910 [Pirellulales bacterium]
MAKSTRTPRKGAAKPAKSTKARVSAAAAAKAVPKRAASPLKRKTRAAAKPRACKPAACKPSTAARRRKAAQGYAARLSDGARKLGQELRRGAAATGDTIRHIRFNRIADFCKKELRELAALANKINRLANQPAESRPTRARK